MSNTYFQFKQFTIHQDRCAMKVTTDACLFGAILSSQLSIADTSVRALDIGTGTGLLSLMLAQAFPGIDINALEIDREAATQARENILSSPWKNNITVIHEDLLEYETDQQFDLVFSNPPFYENELNSPDARINLARHNQELPLAKLFQRISNLMSENGEAWVLLPYKRNTIISQLLQQYDLSASKFILIRNSTTHDYFRIILRIKKTASSLETIFEEFSIYGPDGKYDPAFVELLKPYYLRL